MLLADYLFYEMLGMGLSPDQVVCNAIIHSYAKYGDVQKAFALHREMIDRGIHADKMTYDSLIVGNFREGKLSGVKDLVNDLKRCLVWLSSQHHNLSTKSIADLRKEGRSDVEEANFWQAELHNGVLAVVRIWWEYGHFFPDPQYENVQHIICCDSYARYDYDLEFAKNVGFPRVEV
ncbi:hypothetical protein SO802_006997 [Lithocarpus litseifolius]|uniref:Pentatricopeptide repeat-containing protein n=1 Tax=Lithocarpus litseifolius TaxID=425828 RepID=A0AAW2DQW2_9ROSI